MKTRNNIEKLEAVQYFLWSHFSCKMLNRL